jgi:hypothetical protein
VEVAEAFIDHGIIEALTPLLSFNDNEVVKDAFWILANLCGGSPSQNKAAYELFPFAILRLRNPEDGREAILHHAKDCIIGAVIGADPETLALLLEQGILDVLLVMLWADCEPDGDTERLQSILESLAAIVSQCLSSNLPQAADILPTLKSTYERLSMVHLHPSPPSPL